jgi:RHS repeat-associated protein
MGKIINFLIALSLIILFSQDSWALLLASQEEQFYLSATVPSDEEIIYPFSLARENDPAQEPVYPLAKLMDNFDIPSASISTWWDIDGRKVYQREIDQEFMHSGVASMRINYRKASSRYKFSFFAFQPNQDGVDNDFSRYEALSFWIYSEEDMELIVKLEDSRKKKGFYEEKFQIEGKPEWQHIEFKFKDAEKIDLARIDNVLFFVQPGKIKVKGKFWIDDLYLVREAEPGVVPEVPEIEGINLTGRGHQLNWRKAEGASLYQVLIAENAEFRNPVSIYSNETSLLVDDFVKGLSYFKVRAWSHLPEYQGLASDYSRVYSWQPEEDTPPIIEVVWSQAGGDTDNNYPIGALIRLAVKEKYNAQDIVSAQVRITSESTNYDSGWQDLHLSESKDYYFYHWNTLGLKPASDYRVEFLLKDKAGQVTKDDSLIITLSANLPIVISPTFRLSELISFRNFVLDIQYDKHYPQIGPLGKFWQHSYQTRLRKYADGSIEVVWAEGGSEFFELQSNGEYKNIRPSLFLSQLREISEGYEIRTKWAKSYIFDPEGKLTKIRERNGNETEFLYQNGLLKEIRDPYGVSLKIEYWDQGLIKKIVLPYGGEIEFYYEKGLLKRIKDINGKGISFYYFPNDLLKNVVESIDGERKITYFSYDAQGRLKERYEGESQNKITYKYYEEEAKVEVYKGKYGESKPFIFIFNSSSQPIYIEDPLGGKVYIHYNKNGLVSEIIDKNNYAYKFLYDERENITQIITPLGNITQITYHPEYNLPLQIKGPRGDLTSYEYDERGNLSRIINPLGHKLEFKYDERNLLVEAIDQNGNRIEYEYDQFGNLIRIRDQLGYEVPLEIEDGLIKSVKDPLGNQIKILYQLPSPLIWGYIDALGYITKFNYNQAGSIEALIDPLNRERNYIYDSLNRLSEIIYPDGSKVQYGYDELSRIIEMKDRKDNLIKYQYDILDRLVAKIYPDGSSIEYKYDPMGNLVYVKGPEGRYEYQYDALNRLTKEILPDDSLIEYQYDEMGNLTKIIYPDGSIVRYEYDLIGRVNKIIDEKSGELYRFVYGDEYCEIGSCPNRLKLTKLIFPNGIEANYGYDEMGKLILLEYNDSEGRVLKSYKYSYDPLLNKTELLSQEGKYNFDYDSLYQLIEAETPFGKYQYKYDPVGNREEVVKGEKLIRYKVNELDQIIKAGELEYKYDKNGNLVEEIGPKGRSQYFYDYDNRLIKVIHSDGSVTEYRYDYLGRRIEKIHNGGEITRYIYAGWKLILEMDGEGNVIRRYVNLPQGGPIGYEMDGKKIFYLRDGNNNITGIVDKDAKIIEEYKYSPFGELINDISGINEILFGSKIYDKETGLYYFLQRYYSPELGRFIQEDPEASLIDVNLYAFANNNPINFGDPYGTCFTWINPRLGIMGGHLGGGKFSLWGLFFFFIGATIL